jgi:hypothetical protein
MNSKKVYYLDQLRGAFFAGKLSAEEKYIPFEQDDILGKFFLEKKYNGTFLNYYGRIVGLIKEGVYTANIFDFDKNIIFQKIIDFGGLYNCIFFKKEEDMFFVFNKYKVKKIRNKTNKNCKYCGKEFSFMFDGIIKETNEQYKMFQRGFCSTKHMIEYFKRKKKKT